MSIKPKGSRPRLEEPIRDRGSPGDLWDGGTIIELIYSLLERIHAKDMCSHEINAMHELPLEL